MVIIRDLLRALLLALLAAPASASAQDDADRFLRRGVYLDGQIWLATDRGSLFRIDERTRRRTHEILPDEVLDICRRDGDLLAVTGLRDVGGWTVRRRSRGAWRIVGRVSRSEDGLGAMDCAAGAPVTLLTTSRMIEIGDAGPREVRLSDFIHAQVRLTTFGTAQYLYVGLNSGEWGGGILRVDRATGRVEGIGRSASLDNCGGVLCEPVHAFAPIPWRPGCLAAAAGLVHFISHGQVAQFCEERVETLYSRNVRMGIRDDAESDMTTSAFFGVERSGDALLVAGVDALYRIGPAGLLQSSPYPAFREVRGVRLSFDRPDVVLVVTQINRRASVSPGAPLLIPR